MGQMVGECRVGLLKILLIDKTFNILVANRMAVQGNRTLMMMVNGFLEHLQFQKIMHALAVVDLLYLFKV